MVQRKDFNMTVEERLNKMAAMAIELLEMYEESERAIIWERSGPKWFQRHMDELDDEVKSKRGHIERVRRGFLRKND